MSEYPLPESESAFQRQKQRYYHEQQITAIRTSTHSGTPKGNEELAYHQQRIASINRANAEKAREEHIAATRAQAAEALKAHHRSQWGYFPSVR